MRLRRLASWRVSLGIALLIVSVGAAACSSSTADDAANQPTETTSKDQVAEESTDDSGSVDLDEVGDVDISEECTMVLSAFSALESDTQATPEELREAFDKLSGTVTDVLRPDIETLSEIADLAAAGDQATLQSFFERADVTAAAENLQEWLELSC